MKWRLWLAQYREQVHIKIYSTVIIILKVFYKWRPKFIPKIICQATNKIRYFHKDMFNSSI